MLVTSNFTILFLIDTPYVAVIVSQCLHVLCTACALTIVTSTSAVCPAKHSDTDSPPINAPQNKAMLARVKARAFRTTLMITKNEASANAAQSYEILVLLIGVWRSYTMEEEVCQYRRMNLYQEICIRI